MKRNTMYILLAVEAVALCLCHLIGDIPQRCFSTVFAFPFEQIGLGLNALSSLDAVGNGLALALLVGVSLLPAVPALRTMNNPERRGENIALTALSVVLLPVLYCMSNPSALLRVTAMADKQMLPGIKMVLGSTVWSIAACWLVLYLLRLFRTGKRRQLMTYLERMLFAACALFVAGICISCVGDLANGLEKAQLSADYLLTVVRFLVSALPYAADIAVAFAATGLLDKLSSEGSTETTVTAARKLSSVSAKGLVAVAVSGAAMNIIQLAAAPLLSHIHTNVNIPVFSLIFVLASLLLSRLIAENKRLSEDNGLFI